MNEVSFIIYSQLWSWGWFADMSNPGGGSWDEGSAGKAVNPRTGRGEEDGGRGESA